MNNATVRDAIKIAQAFHKDQLYGDVPYIVHLMLVERRFTVPVFQMVAVLHDILEDTNMNLETILDLFGDEVADAVDAITHRVGELYMDYIKRLSTNHIAKVVKIADIEENLFSLRNNFPQYARLEDKYIEALKFLISA